MNTNTPTLEFIKRQAKNLKNIRNITHVAALEILAKQHGFSNYKHLKKVVNTPMVNSALQNSVAESNKKLIFIDWLKKHKNRDSPLGDLASDKRWPQLPSFATKEEYIDFLQFKGAGLNELHALDKAWKSYKRYLKREPLTNAQRAKRKELNAKRVYPRKIVFVKNVKPLHYTKRSHEKFKVGDLAWISWDASKAIPVIITEIDEMHYSFNIERPLSRAGRSHYLRLDEVRSTPELGCMNCVTN